MKTATGKLFIIGAGYAGKAIAHEIIQKKITPIAAFIDDDQKKIGTSMLDIPIIGPIAQTVHLLKTAPNDEALIAIPSASRSRLQSIYKQLEIVGFHRIKIIPAVSQIVGNGVHLALTRDINLLDLLGRSKKNIDLQSGLEYVHKKRVLISGAGGSIGSELARLMLYGGVSRMYLFGHGENSIYEIDKELRLLQKEKIGKRTDIVPIIGELQDKQYVEYICKKLQADIIFHTAAYKHVPLSEENAIATIANNLFGTQNLIAAANKARVKKFTLISTDKAVDPVSMYGISKKLAEQVTLMNNGIVVRFGNVLGSRGSIIPLFQKQIEYGGPLTITTRQAKRYFMTISEAAALVLKTCAIGKRGGLYALNLGDHILIKDLAEQLIRFYGYTPHVDIKLEYIGLRSGEKEFESLLGKDEQAVAIQNHGIEQIIYPPIPQQKLHTLIETLHAMCYFTSNAQDIYRDNMLLRKHLADYLANRSNQ